METRDIAFVREIFAFLSEGLLKIRTRFTQNINQPKGKNYDEENMFSILYYDFLKHALACDPSHGTSDTNL